MNGREPDAFSKDRRPSARRVLIFTVIGLSIGAIPFSAAAYAAGMPPYLFVWADVSASAFVALAFLTGKFGEAGKLTPRRASVFFGVVPAIGVVAGLLMVLVGVGIPVALYLFSAIIILCNFIYWTWFDHEALSSPAAAS